MKKTAILLIPAILTLPVWSFVTFQDGFENYSPGTWTPNGWIAGSASHFNATIEVTADANAIQGGNVYSLSRPQLAPAEAATGSTLLETGPQLQVRASTDPGEYKYTAWVFLGQLPPGGGMISQKLGVWVRDADEEWGPFVTFVGEPHAQYPRKIQYYNGGTLVENTVGYAVDTWYKVVMGIDEINSKYGFTIISEGGSILLTVDDLDIRSEFDTCQRFGFYFQTMDDEDGMNVSVDSVKIEYVEPEIVTTFHEDFESYEVNDIDLDDTKWAGDGHIYPYPDYRGHYKIIEENGDKVFGFMREPNHDIYSGWAITTNNVRGEAIGESIFRVTTWVYVDDYTQGLETDDPSSQIRFQTYLRANEDDDYAAIACGSRYIHDRKFWTRGTDDVTHTHTVGDTGAYPTDTWIKLVQIFDEINDVMYVDVETEDGTTLLSTTEQYNTTFNTLNIWTNRGHDNDGFKILVDDITVELISEPQSCDDLIALGLNSQGDLTGDCKVDFADFAKMAIDWLKCSDPNTLNCN